MAPITEATRPAAGAEPTLPWHEEFYGAMEAKVDLAPVFAGAEGGGAG